MGKTPYDHSFVSALQERHGIINRRMTALEEALAELRLLQEEKQSVVALLEMHGVIEKKPASSSNGHVDCATMQTYILGVLSSYPEGLGAREIHEKAKARGCNVSCERLGRELSVLKARKRIVHDKQRRLWMPIVAPEVTPVEPPAAINGIDAHKRYSPQIRAAIEQIKDVMREIEEPISVGEIHQLVSVTTQDLTYQTISNTVRRYPHIFQKYEGEGPQKWALVADERIVKKGV